MNTLLSIFADPQFFYTALRVTTPILYAALACYVLSRVGVDPIAVEGVMLISALAGPIVGYVTQSAFWGVLCAGLVGAGLEALFVVITVKMESNEILTGVAYNSLAEGLTVAVLFYMTGEKGSTQSLSTPEAYQLNYFSGKSIYSIFFNHSVLTYLAIFITILTYILFFKTPKGIEIRAVGEKEEAAAAAGINTFKVKIITSILGGCLIGLGGSFMSMAYVNGFSRGMVAGRGFIGMAANGMGGGSIIGLAISSFIFGLSDAFAIRLQLFNIPQRLVQTIPYIITIVGITIYSYRKKKAERGKLNDK